MRRTILPKLQKKLKTDYPEGGNKRKRGPRHSANVFNPILHVKKESYDDESTMTTSINIDNDLHHVSTLTDAENCYNLVTKIKTFFKTDGTAVLTEDLFNELMETDKIVPTNNCEKEHSIQELATPITICPPMPELGFIANNSKDIQSSPDKNNTLENNNKDTNEDDNNNEMVHTCQGGCKYNMVINENPYQQTLDRDYGKNIVCVKKDCRLSLLQCFKNRDKGGCAYICDGCKKHDCKNMYCVRCFMLVDMEKGKSTRQRRSSRNTYSTI